MKLQIQKLTKQAFATFGDVIETEGSKKISINQGNVVRHHDLANVVVDYENSGRALISVFECVSASALPHSVDIMERHPLGSQAFIPLSVNPFVIVVAKATEGNSPGELEAFISKAGQGVNYNPGTWHMPLICFSAGESFIVVDRGGSGHNLDEVDISDRHLIIVP
jgi:ureidoglycolate lyase